MLRLVHCFVDPKKERSTFFVHQSPIPFDQTFSTGTFKDFPSFMSSLNTSNSVSSIIQSVERIVYYISASNWMIVFSNIKSTIVNLTSTLDEPLNIYALHLLDYCALNQSRLTSVLATFQTNFPKFKRNARIDVVIHLRKAIWNWIINRPKEFKKLQIEQKLLYDGLENFFDVCDLAVNSIFKKLYFWPLQMDLLILCPDDLIKLIVEMDSNITSKKSFFLSSLKSAIKSDHTPEIAVICYTDICTAASKIDDGTVPSSPLWRLLPEAENGLKQWLYSPIQPYIYGSDLVHSGITIDHQTLLYNADVSLLTISPTYCLESLKMFYLNGKVPLTAKITKLNALLHMKLNGIDNINDVSPHNNISLEVLADSTRRLFFQLTEVHNRHSFQSTSTSLSITQSSASGRLTNANYLDDSSNIDVAIQNIMVLIQLQPQYAFATTKNDNMAETERLLIMITNYLNHPSAMVSEIAASCLLTLHEVDNILLWDKLGYHISAFWKISSQVIFLISQQILNRQQQKGLDLKQLLSFLKQLFISRLKFLKSYNSMAPTEYCSHEWLQASIGLEVTLLVHLCSPYDYIAKITAECIGLFCEELQFIEYIGEAELVSLTAVKNINTYLDISNLVNVCPGGRKSYQRKICQLLKQVKYCSPGNLAAWEEVWKRWMAMLSSLSSSKFFNDNDNTNQSIYGNKNWNNSSSSVHSSSGSSSPTLDSLNSNEEWLLEWESYTYFLASLGQVCIYVTSEDNHLSLSSLSPSPSTTTSTPIQISTSIYTTPVSSSTSTPISSSTSTPLSSSSSYSQNAPITSRNKHHIFNTDRSLNKEPLSSNNDIVNSKTTMSENHTEMANKFISTLIDLLFCENTSVRDHVYEIIGIDMSSAFYSKMLQFFKIQMDKSFNNNNTPIHTPQRILFVEQAINILRLILAREESVDELMTAEYFELIIQFLTYIDGLEKSDNVYNIKTKMCKLIETVIQHKSQYGSKKNIAMRKHLLDYITKWNSHFHPNSKYNSVNNNDFIYQQLQQQQQQVRTHRRQRSLTKNQPQNQNQVAKPTSSLPFVFSEKLRMELDKACINCSVVLLYQLPLYPTKPINLPDNIQESSELFYKYYNFFLHILNLLISLETRKYDEGALVTEKIIISTMVSYKGKIVLCLSNLLSSNINIGLKYALSMVYHDDIHIRIAFIQVLDNILKQGTEFEALSNTVKSENYKKLVQQLFRYNCAIVSSLYQVCSVADIDDVSIALLASFTSENNTMGLLKIVIQQEIKNTDYEENLFRKTSIATKCWTLFAKLNGNNYMKSVLQPVINQLKERDNELSFELDSNKIDQNTIEINKRNITSATNLILDSICNSVNSAPIEFRFVLNFILRATKNRFPTSIYKALGSFLFLRFFCPAIVSPETEGMIEPKDTSLKLRRVLLFIAKIIQNLANGILFGKKEVHLAILNDYMIENIPRVTRFLHDMAMVAYDEEYPNDEYPIQMVEEDYHVLQRVLTKYIDDIQREFTSQNQLMFLDNNGSMVSCEQFIDEINKLLSLLGPLPERTKMVEFDYMQRRNTYSNKNTKYTEFMRKYRNKDVDTIPSKDILYHAGTSKGGRSVAYFIYRKIQNQIIDFELFFYHMLKELEKLASKPFILVVDITQFGPRSRIPEQYIEQLSEIIPDSISANLSIIIYNPNTCFRKYLNEVQKSIFRLVSKRMTFAITLEEMHEFIDPQELKFPKSTMNIAQDSCVVFSDVTRIWPSNTQTPVLIKVSAEFIQIITKRKQDIFAGIQSATNDVYDLTELQVISGTEVQYNQPNRIYLRPALDDTEICIQSLKSKEILNTILKNKQEYESVRPSSFSKRVIRPNDVPGRLLNVAFLNLLGDDFKLRISAYHLLQTLCKKFEYNNTFTNLLDTKDICLPANCINLVTNISEYLASSEQHLTLEFLNEFFMGIEKTTNEQQYLCILYVLPWITNLGDTCSGSPEEINKTKALITMIIKATYTINMHKPIQVRLWSTLGEVDGIRNMLIETSIELARHHGIGSKEAECIADTFVSISSITVRSKLMALTLRNLRKTAIKPSQSLMDHPLWTEIGILIRLNLMLSFDNCGPLKNYVPDILHMITSLIGVGPTFIRTSIYGIIVNLIQTLCMSPLISDSSKQGLQQLVTYSDEKRSQLMYGLVNPHADVFTINSETLSDPLAGYLDSDVLENIIKTFLHVIELGAPNIDIANAWRSRWLSHITSDTFQFNPAIQPRTFIALGYLGGGQIDDNIMYQVLASLKKALLSFNPNDTYLILSILKCLRSLIEHLDVQSRYTISLFWIAIGVITINHSDLICVGMELLDNVLRLMDFGNIFNDEDIVMEELLLEAREPVIDLYEKIDNLSGVQFNTHFSFAVAGLLTKGWGKTHQAKMISNQCLIHLLSCATKHPHKTIDSQVLGYVAGLISHARKMEKKKNMYCFAGMCWQMDNYNDKDMEDEEKPKVRDTGVQGKEREYNNNNRKPIFLPPLYESTTKSNLIDTRSQQTYLNTNDHHILFEKLNTNNPTLALLFITCLATQVNLSENDYEQNYLYDILADAATCIPQVFSIIYPTLLNKMNQHMLNCQNLTTLQSIKRILISFCSDPVIHNSRTNINDVLNNLGFPALYDISFGVSNNNMITIASLLSQVIEKFINS
ncbi:unnamed protein product [Cunninghamella echinulata]